MGRHTWSGRAAGLGGSTVEPVVLDTSVLVDLLRADLGARRLIEALDDGADLWGVAVTRTELLAGARAGDGPAIHRALGHAPPPWIDVDPTARGPRRADGSPLRSVPPGRGHGRLPDRGRSTAPGSAHAC